MALTSTLIWDVRTTGADSNGGGFDGLGVASPGTDYSQQDSPQVSYTDLVIGTTSTQLTSAAHPFSSAHVGNIINITGGTGFTTGRYLITSVSGSTANVDRSVGTASSTGGTANLGGGLQTIAAAVSAAVQYNEIHIKAGTYTFTSGITLSQDTSFYGYGTTHNDGGTKPLITTPTDSTVLFTAAGYPKYSTWCNISFSNTAVTRAECIVRQNNCYITVANCTFDGFTTALVTGGTVNGLRIHNCEIKNCTTYGIFGDLGGLASDSSGIIEVVNCYIHDNAVGIYVNQRAGLSLVRSIIAHNTGSGIFYNCTDGMLSIQGCTIANNGSDGIEATGSSDVRISFFLASNIIYGNAGWGIYYTPAFGGALHSPLVNTNNAYGSNTSGNANNLTTGLNAVTITANPFTNSASGDYSLNSTAGGGTACKGAGWPGAFPGGASTGSLDIGAVQSGSGGGSSSGGLLVNSGMQGGMRN